MMVRFFTVCFAAVLISLSLPVWAQTIETNPTPVLPLSSELTTNQVATVITSPGRPAECIAPVLVTRVDGEDTVVSAKGFLIEAGVHTINGKAILDTTNCPLIGSNPVMRSATDLEVDFQPGSIYHVGYYHAPANPEEWRLVVWQTDDNRSTYDGSRLKRP
jgi:hypothetical protein